MRFRSVTVFIFVLSFLITANSGFTQVKTTSSRLKPASVIVELVFDYNQPLPSMYGDMADFFKFKSYGLKFGTGAHINVKISADKKGKIRPYLTLGYDLFLNSDDKNSYLSNNTTNFFPFQGDSTYASTPGTSKLWLHVFDAGLGFEYAFMNKTKWTPYLGLDLDMNIMFGSYRQNPISTTGNVPPGEITFTIKSGTRFGFGFGGGVDARVTRAFGITMGFKYRMANLLGQDSKLSTDVNKFELNDKANTNLNSNLSKNRFMNYLAFYLGASFYLGRR